MSGRGSCGSCRFVGGVVRSVEKLFGWRWRIGCVFAARPAGGAPDGAGRPSWTAFWSESEDSEGAGGWYLHSESHITWWMACSVEDYEGDVLLPCVLCSNRSVWYDNYRCIRCPLDRQSNPSALSSCVPEAFSSSSLQCKRPGWSVFHPKPWKFGSGM